MLIIEFLDEAVQELGEVIDEFIAHLVGQLLHHFTISCEHIGVVVRVQMCFLNPTAEAFNLGIFHVHLEADDTYVDGVMFIATDKAEVGEILFHLAVRGEVSLIPGILECLDHCILKSSYVPDVDDALYHFRGGGESESSFL